MQEIHSTFFHSLIQIAGLMLGFAAMLFFFSFLSSLMNRSSRLKSQNSMAILPDAEGNKQFLPKSAPIILQLNLKGVIGKESLTAEEIETQLIESKQGNLKERKIRGIFLNIDSPGGSAIDSDTIYRRIKAYKEKYSIPVYAYVDGTCASGGIFAACAADKIYATPSSIIGSVGVMWMLPFFNVHKVLEKWEIGVKTFSQGKHKDHLNPFRPWHKGEDADLKNLLSHAYHRFVSIVSKERPKLTEEKLIHEIGAQIYSAPDAADLGFIDEGQSDFSIALSALVAASGISKDEPYQVITLKKKKPWFKELMTRSPLLTGKIEHELRIGAQPIPSPKSELAYIFYLQ